MWPYILVGSSAEHVLSPWARAKAWPFLTLRLPRHAQGAYQPVPLHAYRNASLAPAGGILATTQYVCCCARDVKVTRCTSRMTDFGANTEANGAGESFQCSEARLASVCTKVAVSVHASCDEKDVFLVHRMAALAEGTRGCRLAVALQPYKSADD